MDNYVDLSKQIRKDILKLTYEKKASFIGSSLSIADILAVLFLKHIRISKDKFNSVEDDSLVLSKGHAASGLYAGLCNAGLIDKEKLYTEFHTNGYKLGVHTKRNSANGIKASSGSLGQGLGLGCGIALSNKIKKRDARVYVIAGDGECNEGSIWESIMFANRFKLDNLVLIIDRNCLQSYGTDDEVLCLGDFGSKLRSFGWNVYDIDGHDCDAIDKAFENAKETKDSPTAIIANTVKGKGVKEFENKVLWHYKWPETNHYEEGLKEIDSDEK